MVLMGEMSMADVAGAIDADSARLAVARVFAVLGSQMDWDSSTVEYVADAVRGALPTGLPSFTDQDDSAVAFWGGLS